jgi:DNA-binding MarR family transcriptional regulator
MRVAEAYYVARRLRSWLEDAITHDLDHRTPLYLWIVVRDVVESPGTSIRDISRRLGMVQSMVSKAVATAEDRGWIERHPDRTDARLVRVFPSAALSGRLEAVLTRTVDEVIAELLPPPATAAERALVVHALTMLYGRFKAVDEAGGGQG